MTDQRARRSMAGEGLDALSRGLLGTDDEIEREFGVEAGAAFEEELLRFQRHRCVWYCIGSLVVVSLIFIVDLLSMKTIDFSEPDWIFGMVDPTIDAILIVIYIAFLFAFRAIRGPRTRIVHAFCWLLAIVGSGMTLASLTLWTQVTLDNTESFDGAALFVAGGTSVVMVFLLHFFASLFVVLSPREALLPLIPITLTYVVGILVLVPGPWSWRAIMLASWVFAGGPGFLWSVWRYRRFVEGFRWRFFHGRYSEIRRDLSDARRVHESLFPPPFVDGAVRLAWIYEPMRDVGGDYLFVRRRAHGGLMVVLVDVSGHGIASALAASRVHGELERLDEDQPRAGPGETLCMLNRFVHRSLAGQAIFATAVAVEVPPEGPWRYASAGHPSLLRHGRDGSIEVLESTATILGALDSREFEAGERSVELASGECIVAVTDGVLEAANARNEFFGSDRLTSVVRDAASGGADRVPPAVLEAVHRFRSGEATDDALVASLWRVRS